MKKIVKNLVVITIILVALITLVGCNKSQNIVNHVAEPNDNNEIINFNAYIINWDYIYEMGDEDRKIIISDYTELKEFCGIQNENNDIEEERIRGELLSKYNEEFFENKSLALVYVSLNASSCQVELKNAVKDGENVKIEYVINTVGDVGLTVMGADLIVVEIDKDITNILLENK